MSESSTLGHAPAMEARPFGISSPKLVMWLFIIADAATFGGVLFGYGYLRAGSTNWTRPFEFLPTIVNGMAMTAILLTSSLTMLFAGAAAREGRRDSAVKWIGATTVLGILFAALHLREWSKMFGEGWSTSANPLGGSALVGASFFSITGLHLLHVAAGVVALTVIGIGYRRGKFDAGNIEITGLYWHFVDLVWMFVFPLVYLLNVR